MEEKRSRSPQGTPQESEGASLGKGSQPPATQLTLIGVLPKFLAHKIVSEVKWLF